MKPHKEGSDNLLIRRGEFVIAKALINAIVSVDTMFSYQEYEEEYDKYQIENVLDEVRASITSWQRDNIKLIVDRL